MKACTNNYKIHIFNLPSQTRTEALIRSLHFLTCCIHLKKTKNNLSTLTTFLTLLLTNCGHSHDSNIDDNIDHWEISRTFKTYCNASLDINTNENSFQIVSGPNQVLIVTTEKNPIFKEGKELTDLNSIQSLLIELDTADSFVTAETPSNSRLFRHLIAFSPDHGIRPLSKREKITLTRLDNTVWKVETDLEDFVFSGKFDFSTNLTLTDTYNDH